MKLWRAKPAMASHTSSGSCTALSLALQRVPLGAASLATTSRTCWALRTLAAAQTVSLAPVGPPTRRRVGSRGGAGGSTSSGVTGLRSNGSGGRQKLDSINSDNIVDVLNGRQNSGTQTKTGRVVGTLEETEDHLRRALDQRQVDTALVYYEQLGSSLPDGAIGEAFLNLLSQKGRFAAAWDVFKSYDAEGHLFERGTLTSLVNLAAKVGEPYAAYLFYQSFERCGHSPPLFTSCGLISALCRGSRKGTSNAQLAYGLWQQLREERAGKLDDAAYRTGLNACVTVGRLDEARALLSDMQAAGLEPDVRAYNILLKGAGNAGQLPLLEELLRQMNTAGVAPTAVTYNSVISAYVRVGDMSRVGKSLQAAERDGVVLDVVSYTTLIRGYAVQGDMEQAEQVVQDMAARGVQPNSVTCATLVDGYVRAGDVAGARHTVDRAVADGIPLNVWAFNTLLRGIAQAGSSGGKAPAGAASRKGTSPAASDAAASSSSKGRNGGAGSVDVADAFEVLSEMKEAGVRPDVQTFNTLMDICVRGEQPERAVKVFSTLKRLGYRPDGLCYTTLMKALIRLGRHREACRVFESMDADRSVEVDVAALSAATDASCRALDMTAAHGLLQRAQSLAEERGLPAPVEAYGAVISAQSKQGNVDAALDLVRAFYQKGGEPDAGMFDALVDACVRTGEFNKALQVLRAMERRGKVADKPRLQRVFNELWKGRERRAVSAGFRRRAPRNAGLERFKFWLGLPNRYYESDWRYQDPSSSSDDEADFDEQPLDARDDAQQ